MKIQVTEVDILFDKAEGLFSLTFMYDKGYFTLSRLEEDDKLYLELNEQNFGKYSPMETVTYTMNGNKIELKLAEELARQIKSDKNIEIELNESKETLAKIKSTLANIRLKKK